MENTSHEQFPKNLVETQLPKHFSWMNAIFLLTTPIIAVIAAILYVSRQGFQATDLVPFFIMWAVGGLAITGGYHRYYSHRAFECHRVVQFLFLVFSASVIQNSLVNWASDHRYHHRHVDTDADPYNIKKGFWWAHIGWIFWTEKPGARPFANIRDLRKDPMIAWQQRWYFVLVGLVGFALPTLIGAAFGRPMAGFVWGGLVRIVVLHHSVFMINSAAHWFGTQPYNTKNTARDSWWLPYLSFGEGYHNYHHAFPSDYRNGVKFYQWDPTKWLIWSLSQVGLAWNLKRTSAEKIESQLDEAIERDGLGLSPVTNGFSDLQTQS